MSLITRGWFSQTVEQRCAKERKYDFLLKIHGKNGERALAVAEAPRIDDGYFGPDSISCKVYENVLVAGMGTLSGLFISVLDPDGAYGVGQHSTYYYDTLAGSGAACCSSVARCSATAPPRTRLAVTCSANTPMSTVSCPPPARSSVPITSRR